MQLVVPRAGSEPALHVENFKSAASLPRDVVRGHLVGVAHEEAAVGDCGVVPGLALEGCEAGHFRVFIG